MNAFLHRLVAIAIAIAFSGIAFAQPQPMAWYPLNGTPDDSAGNFGPMQLTNTPFQPGGGILCNGVYSGSGLPDRCDAETPAMPISIFQGFALSVQFKTDSLAIGERPVIVGGDRWRWMAITVVWDGAVQLYYNNGYRVKSERTWAFDTWHTAVMTYDSATATGKLYMNGELVCTASFTIQHGSDRTFSITNFSNGSTFKGVLRDLRIYSTPDIPVGIHDSPHSPAAHSVSLGNYPEPFHARTTINYLLPEAAHTSVRIYDLFGRELGMLVDGHKPAGEHSVEWNAGTLPSGAYLARITAGNSSAVKLLTVRR